MKYIQSYKIFENEFDEIKNVTEVDKNLRDICFDLTDDDFNVGFTSLKTGLSNILSIHSKSYDVDGIRDSGFYLDEVREVVLRIIDYLGDRYLGNLCKYFIEDEDDENEFDYTENQVLGQPKLGEIKIGENSNNYRILGLSIMYKNK